MREKGYNASVRNKTTIERARRERRELTQAEARVWALLRDRRFQQIKFRRQHAIGPYVVDFACVSSRLVIEVDGLSHAREEQAAFEARRTEFLEAAGWRILRVANAEALWAIDNVAVMIDAALSS